MSVLRLLRKFADGDKPVRFVKKGGLFAELGDDFTPPALPVHERIEQRARLTNQAGPRPLWEGYQAVRNYPRATTGERAPNEVRTAAGTGLWFTWLASARRNPTVVEFGTAFGVSGMYWLAGIGDGHLYTFEPNGDWAALARQNLEAISPNFTLTVDTFESAGPLSVGAGAVDIAFIDAIHTSDFVKRQFEILTPLMKPGGVVLFDDIRFSPDMQACWREIARTPGLVASLTLDARVGVIELA